MEPYEAGIEEENKIIKIIKSEEEVEKEERIFLTNLKNDHEKNLQAIERKYKDEIDEIKADIEEEDESDINYQVYKQLLADKQKEIRDCIYEMDCKRSVGIQHIRNQLDESTRFDSDDEEKDIMELNKILTKKSKTNLIRSINNEKKITSEGKFKKDHKSQKRVSRGDLSKFTYLTF